MTDETLPPLPDLDGVGTDKTSTHYPNRILETTLTQIPNPQKEIPEIDLTRPPSFDKDFTDNNNEYSNLLSRDSSSRNLNNGQFGEAESFLNEVFTPFQSFELDTEGLDKVPDHDKVWTGEGSPE